MKPSRQSILSMLDNSVRWTGMPARLADEMSDTPSVDPKHRPLRWIPIWPIAFSCALFILSLIWPPALDRVSPGATISIMTAFWCSAVGMVPIIHTSGPLGKPSLDDDEREAALRKDSFLFCLWLLAALNCLGQPFLMILSHWQNWQTMHSASVVTSAFMLNASLFGCLPTLFASWNLRQLPKE
jgi:hypothetical protein